MTSKEEKVVNYLLCQTGSVKIETICANCQVSKRSVYNYLDKLKNDPSFVLEQNKTGIILKKVDQGEIVKKPESYEERRDFIFRKGLIMQRALSTERLLDYFSISEATLHAHIVQIRKEIRRFGIKLISKNGELFFAGNYHNLKKLTQYVIYRENCENSSLLSVDTLAEVFPMIDVRFVKDAINSALQKNNLFMDEYSLINLLLHITISLNQEVNGIIPRGGVDDFNHKDIIEEICAPIEEKYKFEFSNTSKQQFALILATRVRNEDSSIYSSLKNKESIDIVDEIFQKLYENYNLDMNTASLKNSFCLHIDSLISRLKNNIIIKNPLHNLIKTTSPITYDLAIYAANIINSRTGYTLSENEIAYIALHLGTRLEEIRSARSRLQAAIVCPEYYMYNSNLQKLSQVFNEELYVKNVYTSFDDVEEDETIDLFICTVLPTKRNYEKRIVLVTPFLSHEDRKKISEKISAVKKQKRIKKNKDMAESLFMKELFFNDIEFKDKEEAIDFITKKLIQFDYVSNDFKEAIINRKHVAPTDFNQIAIPHPVDYNAKKTVISVALLKKPLFWSKNRVSIIFMIAMNNNDFVVFEDVFSSLIEITNDNDKVERLVSSRNYEDFMRKLVEMIYA